MRNIKFTYLYRDGGNYKNWDEVVFSNPDGLSPKEVISELRKAFTQDGLFIAHQVRLPEAFPYSDGDPTLDDHCFHEFGSIDPTAEAPNDRVGRSISNFLIEVTREASIGWRAFDPYDRLQPIGKITAPWGQD